MKRKIFNFYRNRLLPLVFCICIIFALTFVGTVSSFKAEADSENLAEGAKVTCDVTHSDFPASGLTDGNIEFNNGHTMIVQNAASYSLVLDLGEVREFELLTLIPSADAPSYFVGKFCC